VKGIARGIGWQLNELVDYICNFVGDHQAIGNTDFMAAPFEYEPNGRVW
jgi:hypothetical protein